MDIIPSADIIPGPEKSKSFFYGYQRKIAVHVEQVDLRKNPEYFCRGMMGLQAIDKYLELIANRKFFLVDIDFHNRLVPHFHTEFYAVRSYLRGGGIAQARNQSNAFFHIGQVTQHFCKYRFT